jgi:hypothetical protein
MEKGTRIGVLYCTSRMAICTNIFQVPIQPLAPICPHLWDRAVVINLLRNVGGQVMIWRQVRLG